MIQLTGRNYRLGRRAKSMHRHPMKFSTYLTSVLPPLVSATAWSNAVKVPWGMDLNDQLGDCTCAGPAHNVMAVTANIGKLVIPTNTQVLTMYEASGYVDGQPNTDQGWTLQAAEGYMVSTGLGGVKADGFVEVDPTNMNHIKYALQLLGPTLNFGLNLPQSAMDVFQNTPANQTPVWSAQTITNRTIIGGHDVAGVDFTSSGCFKIISWGREVIMTPGFILMFCDEVSAMYFNILASKLGLNIPQMDADAEAIAEAA